MSKNGLRGLIALIMVAVIGFGLFIGWGIGSKWGEIKNIKDYFNGWGQNKPDDGGNKGGELEINRGEAYGIMLLDGDIEVGTADNVKTITAQVIDEITGEALDKIQTVEFIMDWKGGEYTGDMTTSTDISHYVTMEVDGMTARFTCLNAFETPITVTCRSTINQNKYATAQLDYIQPLFFGVDFGETYKGSVANQGVYPLTVQVPYASSYSELSTEKIYTLFTSVDRNVLGTKSYWSDYAVEHCPAISVGFTAEFKEYVQSQMNASFYMPYLNTNINRDKSAFTVSLQELLSVSSQIKTDYGKFMQLFNRYEGAEIEVSFGTLTSRNGKQEEITVTCKYYVDLSIPVIVGDVDIDNPSIDFGEIK